jgi:uncharacterized protein (TIGR03067 family)
MRLIMFAGLCLLCLNCSTTKKASSASYKLNGTWVPVKEEIGGTALPATAFATQKLIIMDTTYTFIAESVDKGVLKYDHEKMDIYGKEGVNAGRHFTAIYKFIPDSSNKGEHLAICYNLTGNGYPETFETKDQRTFFLSIFRKE